MKTIKMNFTTHCLMVAALVFCNLAGSALQAQILDYKNKVSVTLDDGTTVILYGKANKLSDEFSHEYYYLPANLRLSQRDDGTPEFLFMKYTTEEKADAGGVQGALMHFLMEWGLTADQERELQSKLEQKLKNANSNRLAINRVNSARKPKLLGPANLRSDTEESFRIVSGTLTSGKFTPNLVTTGRAPLIPGAKIAVASVLEKDGAQLLASTFEKNRSISDVSISLRFRFDVLMPKVNGRITVDWERVVSLYQKIERNYSHTDKDDDTLPFWNSLGDDEITDVEKDSLIDAMQTTEAVKIDLDISETDNPIAQEVVNAFMDFFIQSITTKSYNIGEEALQPMDRSNEYQPQGRLYKYKLDRTKYEKRIARKKETYELNVRLPITEEMIITENLASWYDGVKHNEKCVSSVYLNDPFFQHRDINFILDLEAQEMFDQEVNYVTVNVRKRRPSGNDFKDAVTISKDFLENHGTLATMTYARGSDDDSELYEYNTQWSLRGGNIFPENPEWKKGDWQGVTLAPPVKPRNIEFEADLEELSRQGIVRATLQLRYYKFGKETESNIPLTVSKQLPLIEQMIFTDRNTQGYVYRLILTHKEKGKLALDWESKINDDYVYATIPEELQAEDPGFLQKALKAGKEVLKPNPDGTVEPKDNILNKFGNIIDNFVTNE